MNRLFKVLTLAIAGIVLLVVLSAVAILLFVDPNNFRDEIAAKVETATGRSLTIEGDLSVSIFPWLAVEMGETHLGNAAGFDDEAFASFDSARLSVRLLPLLLRREIAVGTASLESLRLNLEVSSDGSNNWQDLASGDDTAAASQNDAAGSGLAGLDIASVEISDAEIHYRDRQSGAEYTLDDVDLSTGRIALGTPFDVRGEFAFDAKPDDINGKLTISGVANIAEDFASIVLDELVVDGEVRGIAKDSTDIGLAAATLNVDIENSRLAPTSLVLTALGLTVDAEVRALSWANDLTADAGIKVAQFSLPELLGLLDIEAPETADPNALRKLSFSADAALDASALTLSKMNMQLDDTTVTGELALPMSNEAPIRFDLSADRMDVDRYMAPGSEDDTDAASAAADDFEIPVEMIRGLNARGNLRLAEATLSGMRFTNMQLGLNVSGGKLQLNPLSADLFDGTYSGDVRIDASGETPALSLNEQLTGVSLTPLAQAMFERDNITGSIAGRFVLTARGKTLSAMRQNLNGTMSFELADGAWQGVDMWQQLRTARALYKREEPPPAKTPVQTEFSSVKATGTVTDGVFSNDDLLAEMPFLQLTGNGVVNLVAGEIDYALQARVLERPEFVRGATDAELSEFTEALIPVRVRGPLADPSVRPDIEAMFRKEVEDSLKEKGDELRQRLLDRIAPPKDAPAGDTAEGAATDSAEPAEEPSVEDQLKDRLKKLLER
ncbi:MAG: AsmA family protein [Woeseia sp.]